MLRVNIFVESPQQCFSAFSGPGPCSQHDKFLINSDLTEVYHCNVNFILCSQQIIVCHYFSLLTLNWCMRICQSKILQTPMLFSVFPLFFFHFETNEAKISRSEGHKLMCKLGDVGSVDYICALTLKKSLNNSPPTSPETSSSL